MYNNSASLQEGVNREPSEMRQTVFQACFPVTIQPVMIIEELPGSVYNLIRRHFSIEFQFRLRRQRTDFLKNRAVGDLRPVQERFNGVPENGFIDSSIFIFVKHGKKLFKFSVLIVASCGSINNVPVDIHIAVAVISLEIRSKGIVLCAVPDDIVCPPLLKIRNSLTHN